MPDYRNIDLNLTPGLLTVNSSYAAKGRYIAGSNIRFFQRFPERIGGWHPFISASLGGPSRGVHAWSGPDGSRYMAFGTATHLWLMKDGALFDITPVGLTAGLVDAAPNTLVSGGWGSSGWGGIGWGGGNSIITSTAQPRTWRLANWGQDLVASYRGGPLYLWSAAGGTGVPAAQVANAPTVISDFWVSETNRYLIALGATGGAVAAGGGPMTVAWCDREAITTWAPTTTNTAGDKRLEIGSEIITSVDVRGGRLLFTDAAVYLARYIGPPFIFGIDKVGEGYDPPIGPNAAVARDGVGYWLGHQYVSSYNGAIQRVPCDVHDEVYGHLHRDQAHKVWAGLNRKHGEILWFYPDRRDGAENSRHVAVNSDGWSLGTLARTCWIDANVSVTSPVATDASGAIFLQEQGGIDGNGAPIAWELETGEVELEQGDLFMRVRKLIPDWERLSGSPTLELLPRRYPVEGAGANPARTMTLGVGKTSVRARGRSIRFRMSSSSTNNDFRLGVMRAAVRPDGARG